jgi:transcriptional regulator with XRE-family HTH domain
MNQSTLFGKRVRTLRKAARITQEKAAEAAHLNSKYLGEIERGEKRPSFEAIIALAKALSVSPAVFFQFDGDESDEKTLRRKIEVLLSDASAAQLLQVHKVLKAFLEP